MITRPLLIVGASLALFGTASAEAPQYSVQFLDFPNGQEGIGYDINDQGWVAGESLDGAILWNGSSLLTLASGRAMAVNNAGTVALAASDGLFWWRNGQQTAMEMDLEQHLGYQITGMNEAELTIGLASPAGDAMRAVYWDVEGLHELQGLGGSTGAFEVNDGGLIVGFASAEGQETPAWWKNGVLHTLDGVAGRLLDVNNSGLMVGVGSGDGWSGAFLYDGETVTPLVVPGLGAASGASITDGGHLVVQAWTGLTMIKHGSQWYSLYDSVDWNGADSYSGSAMNNLGQFTGWARKDGDIVAFIATPVPEPAGVLSLGALGWMVMRRRRLARP